MGGEPSAYKDAGLPFPIPHRAHPRAGPEVRADTGTLSLLRPPAHACGHGKDCGPDPTKLPRPASRAQIHLFSINSGFGQTRSQAAAAAAAREAKQAQRRQDTATRVTGALPAVSQGMDPAPEAAGAHPTASPAPRRRPMSHGRR